ncbi:MAG: LuxR family transcriptional regulator [Mycolicibacterium sp.]|uniref:HTH luxR-type domain-containing protein n=2 Tax=Mycolicibacterium insubricum TaxID=444597 RepID=A0A1X0DN79_9MYCO|nr:LuxR C-terminal-related transcriptional regulator [Mycolicibacterium insubricum]MCB9441761.1 LuxR family transcriptional regulator [Mycolicibacterium sp.]ORA73787.1 hypothetical protein BST26_01020 [Mycolicibacterium insubricum]
MTRLFPGVPVDDLPRVMLGEHGFSAPLTRFIGRRTELADLRRLIADHRLMTLTGPGGVGKTRLAVQLAGSVATEFDAGAWYVDLASISDPTLVPVTVARTFGLPDWPVQTDETLTRFIGDRTLLVVLDNCEHLVEACADLVTVLLRACPGLTILATSREPIRMDGELIWPTPPLSPADEAVQLFADRARLARPEFTVGEDNAGTVTQLCRGLDGIPLAVELAAARVRAMSLTEILDGLHDRFGLLSGTARTAASRHQTLRASMDWSHALLSEPEQVVFRRLAVFLGGFELDAAHAVAGDPGAPRHQILDELALLVDKSLVVADDRGHRTRYQLLETVRQYALDKLREAGDADTVWARHRDHYTRWFAAPVSFDLQAHVERAEIEIDNLRAAFTWSQEHGDHELAARLASSLQPLWLTGGRISEGLAWFGAVLAHGSVLAPAVRARVLADRVTLETLTGSLYRVEEAQEALTIARDLGDPALLAQALAAYGLTCGYSPGLAAPYFAEALELATALGDDWQLSRILSWQAFSAYAVGDPVGTLAAASRGLELADAVGDGSAARLCRWCIGLVQLLKADVTGAAELFRDVAADAGAAHDLMSSASGLMALGIALAHRGDTDDARAVAHAAIEAAADLPGFQQGAGFGALVDVELSAGDVTAAVSAAEAAVRACPLTELLATNGNPVAKTALVSGDVDGARRSADEAVAVAAGTHQIPLLSTSIRIAIAAGDTCRAQRDARDALAIAAATGAHLALPDIVECVATLTARAGNAPTAVRLLGAAAGLRTRAGQVRFRVYDADQAAQVTALRNELGNSGFQAAWDAGAELSAEETIAYTLRGRGERKRPASGWASLTPTEIEVAGLVSAGLGNKEIGTRLFISPRTVQTHLTHIYAKLGVASRVQLVQEVSRHS